MTSLNWKLFLITCILKQSRLLLQPEHYQAVTAKVSANFWRWAFCPQVLVIERKNEDGTWPRQASHPKCVCSDLCLCHFMFLPVSVVLKHFLFTNLFTSRSSTATSRTFTTSPKLSTNSSATISSTMTNGDSSSSSSSSNSSYMLNNSASSGIRSVLSLISFYLAYINTVCLIWNWLFFCLSFCILS